MSEHEQIAPEHDATPPTGSQSYDPNSIEGLFLQALQKESPQERDAFLDEVCAGDNDRRIRVTALLRAYEDAGSFLETPVGGSRPTVTPQDVSLDFLKSTDKPGCLGTLGHYEVIDVIGRGGMGIVLRALDPTLNRIVAVKVLAPELAVNPNARRRFLREAQAAAAVSHPHVVTIHAVDEGSSQSNGDQRPVLPYLVMECVVGQSLQEKIDRIGSLPLAEILRIGRQIAEGLRAAHQQGLTHRDIKPANILLENGVERVKITDFGLARTQDDVAITRTGEVSGTPQYMSPEQARGERVDQRSDLFSLGCVLYAMATGHSPFRGDSLAHVIKRVTQDRPGPIDQQNAEIPDWLVEIINQLLEKDPEQRPQSAEEVFLRLEGRLATVQQGPTALKAVSQPQRQDSDSRPIAAADRKSADKTLPIWQRPVVILGLLLILAAAIFRIAVTGGEEVLIVSVMSLLAFGIPLLILVTLIRRDRNRSGALAEAFAFPVKILLWILAGSVLLVPAFMLFSIGVQYILHRMDEPQPTDAPTITAPQPLAIAPYPANDSREDVAGMTSESAGDGFGSMMDEGTMGSMGMSMGSMGMGGFDEAPEDERELPSPYRDGLPTGTTWEFTGGLPMKKATVSVRILSPGMLVALRRKSLFDGSISDDETLITYWGNTNIRDLVPGDYEVLVRDERFGWKFDRKGKVTIREAGHGILTVQRDIAGVVHPNLQSSTFFWNGEVHSLSSDQRGILAQLCAGLILGDTDVNPTRSSPWGSSGSGGFGGGTPVNSQTVDVSSMFHTVADGFATQADGTTLITRGESEVSYRLVNPELATVAFGTTARGVELHALTNLDAETGDQGESILLSPHSIGSVTEVDVSPGTWRVTYRDTKIRLSAVSAVTMDTALSQSFHVTVAAGERLSVDLPRDWNRVAVAFDEFVAKSSGPNSGPDDLFRLRWFPGDDTEPSLEEPMQQAEAHILKRRQLPMISTLLHALAEGRDVEDGPDRVVSSAFSEPDPESWSELIVPGETSGSWRLKVPEEIVTPFSQMNDGVPPPDPVESP